jgi:hypothetical protein
MVPSSGSKIPNFIWHKFWCLVESEQTTRSEITIYAPMIYTAPCVMFLIRAYTLCGQVGVSNFFYSIGQNISSYLPDQLSGALATLASYVAKAANLVLLY